jgi:hypothetical protein
VTLPGKPVMPRGSNVAAIHPANCEIRDRTIDSSLPLSSDSMRPASIMSAAKSLIQPADRREVEVVILLPGRNHRRVRYHDDRAGSDGGALQGLGVEIIRRRVFSTRGFSAIEKSAHPKPVATAWLPFAVRREAMPFVGELLVTAADVIEQHVAAALRSQSRTRS